MLYCQSTRGQQSSEQMRNTLGRVLLKRSRIGKLYLHAGAAFQIDLEVFARFVHCFDLRPHAYRRLAGDSEL